MIFLDTSALVKRYVDENGSRTVMAAMDADSVWLAAAIALTECEISLCQRAGRESTAAPLISALRREWPRFTVIPIDDTCLARAREIGCDLGTRTMDSLHLAAADRLPPPVTFLTFDRRQAQAAAALGFRVRPTGL